LAELATAAEAASFSSELAGSLAAAEPDWLAERRRHAWDVYEATPMPTTRMEEWRYTEVAELALDEVRPADPSEATSAPAALRAELAARSASGTVLQVDAAIVEVGLDEAAAARGVVLSDLRRAALEHGALVSEHLGVRGVPPEFGKFAALNGALWTAGVLLYVPAGVKLARPIRVVRWLSRDGIATFPRTLVIAGPGSELALVEEFVSPDFDAPALSCGAVELLAGAGSRVVHVAVQRWGSGVRHISMQRSIASRDASLDTLVVNLGGSVARVDMAASLEGPGARSDMLGLYFGRGDQHFDHNTRQDHIAPLASSDLLYKGALYDRAHAVFRGIIKVHKGAQRTDAYQTNRNLLLSEEARADSLPNLEIEADDVRCSHGATVGQLDEEEIFYLLSRGLRRRDAERLVVFGFFADVLDRLPLPGVVQELREEIGARIG
jgi:Fe-S cluster assembly protein SufD